MEEAVEREVLLPLREKVPAGWRADEGLHQNRKIPLEALNKDKAFRCDPKSLRFQQFHNFFRNLCIYKYMLEKNSRRYIFNALVFGPLGQRFEKFIEKYPKTGFLIILCCNLLFFYFFLNYILFEVWLGWTTGDIRGRRGVIYNIDTDPIGSWIVFSQLAFASISILTIGVLIAWLVWTTRHLTNKRPARRPMPPMEQVPDGAKRTQMKVDER